MIPGGSPPSRGMSPGPKLHILPVDALRSKSEFITQTSATTHAPPGLVHGVWNTLSVLAPQSTNLSYAPTHFTLVASLDGNKAELASHTLSFLEELTRASYEVASTLLCSSVLAGRTSESDEYGDVGLWIGDLKHGTAADVLRRLGLNSWLHQGAKVSPGPHPLLYLLSTTGTTPDCVEPCVASPSTRGCHPPQGIRLLALLDTTGTPRGTLTAILKPRVAIRISSGGAQRRLCHLLLLWQAEPQSRWLRTGRGVCGSRRGRSVGRFGRVIMPCFTLES
jgi:hypothetical protein